MRGARSGGPSPLLSLMRWAVLLAAVALVGAGAAFAFTGWNRDAAPGLLLAGIMCAVALLLSSGTPRRER